MRYVNLAKGNIYGVDLSLQIALPHQWRIGAGYSYLDAKEQRTDDEDAENYMHYVPINATARHNLTVQSSWSHSWKKYKLGISIFGRYQSTRYYTSDGNTSPYQLWRVNTSHTLINKKKLQIEMNAGVDNIFDYVDLTPHGHNRGTTTPGRTLYTSVIIKFNVV